MPTDPTLDAFLLLVDRLRSKGARRVRWGAFEVELGPEPPKPVERPAESAKDRAARVAAEEEAALFWSSGGPLPDGEPS